MGGVGRDVMDDDGGIDARPARHLEHHRIVGVAMVEAEQVVVVSGSLHHSEPRCPSGCGADRQPGDLRRGGCNAHDPTVDHADRDERIDASWDEGCLATFGQAVAVELKVIDRRVPPHLLSGRGNRHLRLGGTCICPELVEPGWTAGRRHEGGGAGQGRAFQDAGDAGGTGALILVGSEFLQPILDESVPTAATAY